MTHDPDIKPTGPSAGNLLSEALAHVSALVRNEVDLARAEIDENLKTAGVAIGLIVGAVAVALAALHVLAAALVAALTELGHPRRLGRRSSSVSRSPSSPGPWSRKA